MKAAADKALTGRQFRYPPLPPVSFVVEPVEKVLET